MLAVAPDRRYIGAHADSTHVAGRAARGRFLARRFRADRADGAYVARAPSEHVASRGFPGIARGVGARGDSLRRAHGRAARRISRARYVVERTTASRGPRPRAGLRGDRSAGRLDSRARAGVVARDMAAAL